VTIPAVMRGAGCVNAGCALPGSSLPSWRKLHVGHVFPSARSHARSIWANLVTADGCRQAHRSWSARCRIFRDIPRPGPRFRIMIILRGSRMLCQDSLYEGILRSA
jgi:hypothetical protein